MSASPTCNLYCNEEAGDVVSLDADICINGFSSFDNYDDDVENYIVNIFNSEVDQMQGHDELLAKYRMLPEVATARQEAIKWMLKVHSHYRFRPETAYLSVNYLDRFLLSHSLLPGKRWHWQLSSVACLALAAKMEETSVPLLLDLQIIEPRFLFKPKTVQRMELLVMTCLKGRLRSITPFDFLHYFISKLSCLSRRRNGFNCIFSHASDLVVSTSRVIEFWDYPPSTIAAAVVLYVTSNTVDDQKLGCLHKRLDKDMVKRCYNLINKLQKLEHKPSNDKLGVAIRESCDDLNKDTQSGQDLLTNKC